METVDRLDPVDLIYLDPPYNQHRYFTNYHIWETLVRWDEPAAYGVARKRVDCRDDSTRSVFNDKRDMPAALADLIRRARAEVVVVSYNDESWVPPDRMTAMLRDAGHEHVQDARHRLQAVRRRADRDLQPRPARRSDRWHACATSSTSSSQVRATG